LLLVPRYPVNQPRAGGLPVLASSQSRQAGGSGQAAARPKSCPHQPL